MYFLNPFYVSNHEPHKWISSMYNSQNCFLSVWAYATNGLSFSYSSIYSIIMPVKTAQERMFLIWLIVLVCSVLGDCFWAHGVRSRISLQHHMWWRFLLCKNQHKRTQRNKGKAFSPLPPPRTFLQKANSCRKAPSLLQMFPAINPEGIIPLIWPELSSSYSFQKHPDVQALSYVLPIS